MATEISMTITLFVVLAASLLQNAFAITYTVGDATGWIMPINNAELYDDWADNKGFEVGDILVFNFITGQDDVAEVTEPVYDACITNDTFFTENKGPARITLNKISDHYFISTFPGHCSAGQKLHVEVQNGTFRSSPNNPTGILSPPNSASSLVATLSFVFMSIVLVFFCY
ncbi:hypothetical protein DITRI_Ditri03aG0082100 [Diplodiscus trichospermus]